MSGDYDLLKIQEMLVHHYNYGITTATLVSFLSDESCSDVNYL